MLPTIDVGSRTFGTQPLAYLLAFLVVIPFMAIRVRRQTAIPLNTFYDVVDAVFYILLGALAGAWVASVLPYAVWNLVSSFPLPSNWWLGGQHWMGAVAGGSLAGYVYCRRHNLPVGKAFDLFAPFPALAFAFIRLGCLLAGCCYGKETDAWFGLVLPDNHGVWASRYPTRIVSVVANLLIFAVLVAFERIARNKAGKPANWPFDGFLFLLYVQLYCWQRFFFEFWRANMPPLAGPLTWTHLYCAIGIGISSWLMLRGFRQRALLPQPS
jgi:phosphatidylglycerol:prolipoprotein diacylglycerol transferase